MVGSGPSLLRRTTIANRTGSPKAEKIGAAFDNALALSPFLNMAMP
jgi:hypothetical protein